MGRRFLPVLLVVAALLALPAAASATLVYSTQTSRGTSTIWAASNDGTNAFRLGTNYYQPVISPNGALVAAFRQTSSGTNQLYFLPAGGGPATRILSNVGALTVAWSPDSSTIAAVTGSRLVVSNVLTGISATLDTGVFTGSALSFSPDGSHVIYSKAASRKTNAPSNIFVVALGGGPPIPFTTDGQSANPVWGPNQIAYSRGPFRRQGFPKWNIWLMNPDGSGQHQLTHVNPNILVAGLAPLQWSASGAELLANYVGQDTNQAYAVDPVTGSARDLGAKKFDGTGATALSRDGTTVLAQTGGEEGPGPGVNVVTIPFAGGPPTIIVRRGLSPFWNA